MKGYFMQTQLPFFAVVEVSGEDRHEFLHNQLSNDIKNLPEKHACYATYNTHKGRVIANMIVYHAGERLLLILAQDLAEKVVKKLRMYVLRAKVKLDILPDWGVGVSLLENLSPMLPSEPHLLLSSDENGAIILPHGGLLMVAPREQLPQYNELVQIAWQRHEILSAYPWISLATSETCVAQMLNQHIIGGVHFRKGCYPGQEIIARAQYRGQVKRGLAVATCHVVQNAGNFVQDSMGTEVGIVINSVQELNLLVIKHGVEHAVLQDESGNAFAIQQLFFATDKQEQE